MGTVQALASGRGRCDPNLLRWYFCRGEMEHICYFVDFASNVIVNRYIVTQIKYRNPKVVV